MLLCGIYLCKKEIPAVLYVYHTAGQLHLTTSEIWRRLRLLLCGTYLCKKGIPAVLYVYHTAGQLHLTTSEIWRRLRLLICGTYLFKKVLYLYYTSGQLHLTTSEIWRRLRLLICGTYLFKKVLYLYYTSGQLHLTSSEIWHTLRNSEINWDHLKWLFYWWQEWNVTELARIASTLISSNAEVSIAERGALEIQEFWLQAQKPPGVLTYHTIRWILSH